MYGGKINLGYLTYTKIRFWGEQTLATPNERYNGDYIAQVLTPSRLKKIPYVTSVVNSLASLDKTEMAGNSVVNIILPGTTSLSTCEAFLRTSADTAKHFSLIAYQEIHCLMHKNILINILI